MESAIDLSILAVAISAVIAVAYYITAHRGGSVKAITDSIEWLDDLQETARMWVAAAEQIQKTDGTIDKLAYVQDHLRTQFPNVEYPTLRAAIEAAVFFVNERQSPE